jgi:outer membrane protein TolC
MTTNYVLRVISFLFIVSVAQAQTVDSLIQEAFRNNPQLKSFGYQIQAAGFRANAAGALPAPTIGLEFSQIPTNSANILNDAISNNVSVSQMFMLGGKLSAMSDVETKRGKVLEQNLGSLEVQLRAKIKMNYFQLWFYDRQIEVPFHCWKNLHALCCRMFRRTECVRQICSPFRRKWLQKNPD